MFVFPLVGYGICMNSSPFLSAPVRWIILPALVVILAVFLFSEGKNLVRAMDIRLHWSPMPAQLTQTIRQGKGMIGEYQYVVRGTAYSGVVFGGPVSLRSKVGDEIRVWVNPDEPILSGVPDSLLKFPFLVVLLLAEMACIGTIYDQVKHRRA